MLHLHATFHQHNSHIAFTYILQNQAVSSLPMHKPTVPDLPINNLPGYIQNLHTSKCRLQNQAVSSLPMHNPTVSDLPINNLPGYIQNLHVTSTSSYITTNPMLHSHVTSHYWYINIHSHGLQSLTLVLMQSSITIHHGSA